MSDDPAGSSSAPNETPQAERTAGSPSVAVAFVVGLVYFVALILAPFGAAQVLPVGVRISAVVSIVQIGLPALVLATVLLAIHNGSGEA